MEVMVEDGTEVAIVFLILAITSKRIVGTPATPIILCNLATNFSMMTTRYTLLSAIRTHTLI